MNNVLYNKNNRNFTKKLLGVLFFVTIVLNSGYALSTITNIQHASYILLIFCCILLFFNFIASSNFVYRYIDFSLGMFLLLATFFIISIVLNYSDFSFGTSLKPFFFLIFAFMFTQIVQFNKFINYFLNTMKIICLIALSSYLLFIFMSLNINIPMVINSNDAVYYNGFVFFFLQETAGISERVLGIFWEPGLFASFIIFSLILEIIFKEKKLSIATVILFIITLLLTKSTAGIMMIPLIVVLLLSKVMKNKKIILNFLLIFSTLLLFVFQSVLVDWVISKNYAIFSKLLEGNHVSKAVRLESPIRNLSIYLDYPFFGAGFTKGQLIYNEFPKISQTSTSTFYLAALGSPGILFTIIWAYTIFKNYNLDIYMKISFFIIVFLILNKEPHYSILFTQILFFYMINQVSFYKKIIKEKNA